MDCPLGQKIVAVVERWPLVEVQLYISSKARRINEEAVKAKMNTFYFEIFLHNSMATTYSF